MTRSVNRPFRALAVLALSAATLLISGCDRLFGGPPSVEETREIAKELYIYGYPMVVAYQSLYTQNIDASSSDYRGPIGAISTRARNFEPGDALVRPNSDVVVSTLQVDLRSEPMILCMPQVDSTTYFSVQFTDLNMYNIGYINKRLMGAASDCVMIVGPGFGGIIPTGILQLQRSSSQIAKVTMRVQIKRPEDLDLAARIQSGYALQPLSSFKPTTVAQPLTVDPIAWRRFTPAAYTSDFVPTLKFLLTLAPITDPEQKARFGKIGIGGDAKFDFDTLSPEHKAAVEAGFRDAVAAIAARAKTADIKINGWHVGAPFGSRQFFQKDDLLRAAAAKLEPFGLDPTEAIFVRSDNDAQGAPLDASRHNYALRFPSGGFPPVDQLWSVSLYDARTGHLVENPLKRYLINSEMRDKLMVDVDGALILHLQHDAPAADRLSNWLPAPAGPFTVVLRMYTPNPVSPSILPAGRGSWNPPAIVIAP